MCHAVVLGGKVRAQYMAQSWPAGAEKCSDTYLSGSRGVSES